MIAPSFRITGIQDLARTGGVDEGFTACWSGSVMASHREKFVSGTGVVFGAFAENDSRSLSAVNGAVVIFASFAANDSRPFSATGTGVVFGAFAESDSGPLSKAATLRAGSPGSKSTYTTLPEIRTRRRKDLVSDTRIRVTIPLAACGTVSMAMREIIPEASFTATSRRSVAMPTSSMTAVRGSAAVVATRAALDEVRTATDEPAPASRMLTDSSLPATLPDAPAPVAKVRKLREAQKQQTNVRIAIVFKGLRGRGRWGRSVA